MSLPSIAEQRLAAYCRAKDGNRPHLMAQAFAHDAWLETSVDGEVYCPPSLAHGREAITREAAPRANTPKGAPMTRDAAVSPTTEESGLPKRSCPAAAISAYILAKDGNRPHLMPEAFTEGAQLAMDVRTDTIQFPQATHGRDGITDVLVRRFNQTYENVYTFCLGAPPLAPVPVFECGWLVVMSEKASGRLRAGSGRYAWTFDGETCLVSELVITIDGMLVLAPELVPAAMAWARALPYPWCPLDLAESAMPALPDLQPLRLLLRRDGTAAAS